MAAVRNGPARDQDVSVLQGAGVTYTIPVRDPDPPAPAPASPRPNLTGATAAWWLGPLPVVAPRGGPCSVADQPGAYTKALDLVPDPDGGFMVVLEILPADYAGFSPGDLCQHEVWITEPGKAPSPVTFGRFVLQGTVKGAAGG